MHEGKEGDQESDVRSARETFSQRLEMKKMQLALLIQLTYLQHENTELTDIGVLSAKFPLFLWW